MDLLIQQKERKKNGLTAKSFAFLSLYFGVGLPPADAPKKISGVHKRCWKYIPNLPKTEEASQKPETQVA